MARRAGRIRRALQPRRARQRVQPQRLHLDRLADPRRHHPVADLGVHPRELDAGHAARQQPIGIGADAVARAAEVALDDGGDGRAQRGAIGGVEGAGAGVGRLHQVADTGHEPQRGVDGVVLGLAPTVGKAVRQHALRDHAAPLQENRSGDVDAPRRQAQPAQGDERVTAPVGEPGIAGDDRPTAAASHEVGVGGPGQRRREGGAPDALGLEPGRGRRRRRRRRQRRSPRPREGASSHTASSPPSGEGELARRPEVFAVVEAAVALRRVEELPVPIRAVRVDGVGARTDHGQVGVEVPADQGASHPRLALEHAILVVGGVVVAAREQRPHDQPDRVPGVRRLEQSPPHDHARFAARHHDLLADAGAVRGRELPRRPRLGGEGDEARRPIRVDDVGQVALRRQGDATGRRLEPRVEAVDQDDAPGRRCRRRQQQRVIAPRADAADGSRGKAAEAIGLEPFPIIVSPWCGHRVSCRLPMPAAFRVCRTPARRDKVPPCDTSPSD